jgi:DNA invertase Pin-like site-specific DNA recombinase
VAPGSDETRCDAFLYVRVSTLRQKEEGMSLDSQEALLLTQAGLLGFTSTRVVREAAKSGKSIRGRPQLRECLEALDGGHAKALVSAKLDRLSRNARDLLEMVDRAVAHGWRLIVLDVNLDTGTPVGRMVLTILASVAEMERNRMAERQTESHAERRSAGQVWGVTHGPRSQLADSIRGRILDERGRGLSLQAIAEGLNRDSVKTARRGAAWHASTVAHVLRSPATRILRDHLPPLADRRDVK